MKLNVSYCNKLSALFTFLNIVMKMFTKIQFTVQINTQVFLKMCVFNRAISNVQWSVWCGFNFTRKTSHPLLNFNNNKCIFENTYAFIWTVIWHSVQVLCGFRKANNKQESLFTLLHSWQRALKKTLTVFLVICLFLNMKHMVFINLVCIWW